MSRTKASNRRVILATGIAALLGLAGSASAQNFTWDPGTDGDSQIGGSGVWNLTNTFWDPTGTDTTVNNVVWPNLPTSVAVFGGTPGTVTINTGSGVTANGLVFNTSGYQISSNAAADVLTFAGTAPSITLNGGSIARINSVIAGTAGLTISGSGNLTLAGANTLSGQITIAPGTYVGLNTATALGASGAGNETIVQAGGTLNIGGQFINNNPAPATPGEEIRIAGTGVNGIGALVNATTGGNNTLAKVVLTGNATINAGGTSPASYALGGNIVSSAGGRIDIRTSAAPTAGQKHLDLAGFTLTKTGGHLLALVNADVSNGDIVVNEGQLNFEANTLVQGTGTITVNQNGKLGFWSIANASNITRPIVVNGGTIGDPTSTGAAQTVNAPISFTGALNPNFTAISTNRTTLAGVISQNAFTGTGLDKRGGGLLTFSNPANSFSAPITIYAGTLGADYTTVLSGGVPPNTPVTSTDTPLGTNNTITLAGGTLAIRANMDNDSTQQVFDLQKAIVVDRAPGGMTFDRIGNTAQDNKHVKITSLTIAPASASNQYSIGQNQFTFSQGNTHRLEIPSLTMNSDTVLNAGDFTLSGEVLSGNKNSLVHVGGNTWGFIGGSTQQFNALFHVGNGSLRVGSMFGTPVTNDTVTAGTGTIYIGPNNAVTFRTPTNLAAGQIVEALANKVTQSVVNFEQFSSVPSNLRAATSGVIGVGNATAFGDIDLSVIGDGTFRLGSNFAGAGNGTIIGVISPGAGGVVRTGAGGTLTIAGANRVTGASTLEVGSDLIQGGFRVSSNNANQTGTVLLTGSNDYTGGTVVNRGSTLRFQDSASLGTGAITVFGTLTPELTASFAAANGNDNVFTPTLFGGGTIHFNNGGLTGTTDLNRWGDTTPINLTAGGITLTSRNDNASTTNETVGAVNFSGGNSITLNRQVATTAQPSNVAQLTVASLNRIGQGTIELNRNTGTGAGFASGQKLIVTAAPTVTNGMVAPWIAAPNNGPVEFLSYNATNGFTVATYDDSVNATYTAGALTPTDKVDVVTAALTLVDNPTIWALRTNQSINTSGTNNTITIGSGGLISNHNSTTAITIAPNLVFNNGTANVEAIIHSRSGGIANLTGTVTANGLTKFGAGTIQLSADSSATLSGPVSVNQGTLELRSTGAAGTGNITLAGGQLNVRINGAAATYVNGITVAENLPIAVLDVGNILVNTGSATNASAITFNAAAASTPGLVLQGSPGVQGQTFTLQTNGNGTGSSVSNVVFGNNMLNTFTGNVTLNVTGTRTLQLNNNPTINGVNPVITKSGDGTLILGSNGGTRTVSNGTKVVVDNGTLELRSVIAVGTGDTTSITLNRGTLNLRRDSQGTYGTTGSGTAYPVTVNGNATISTDRVGGTATSFFEKLGNLTINNNATLTANNGNGIYPQFTGAQLNGTAFIASNVAAGSQESALQLISGSDVSGGALVKLGTGHLHLLNTNNTYSGGTYVQQGILRARAAGALGTGPVYLNPGGILDLNSDTNLLPTQPLIVRGSGAFMPMLSVNVNGLAFPTTNVDTSNARFGIVGLSNGTGGSYDGTIDLSALYGGRWSLGGVPSGAYDPVFTGTSIVAGSDNLYRLGGGGTSFAMGTDAARGALTNVLTGANDVRFGFDSGNLLPINGGNFQFSIAGTNNYTGGDTVIHRGMVVRLFSQNNGTQSALSNSAVNVFGVLGLSGTASLDNGTGNVNAVTFHPGSALFLDNNNGAANSLGAFAAFNEGNRWNDTTPIALNGAMINLIGNNNNPSSETVGDVTYSRGARLRAQLTGTGTATLTLNNLLGAGPGNTLLLQTSGAGTLGAGDKIIVANNAPASTNGMVTPSIINATDNTFVTHGANGFANVTYDKTVNATYAAGSLLPTDKVDVVTAALTLADNPTVYALRTSQSINNGGPFNEITIRSGGLIATGGTISPNLIFNDGTSNVEARIYNSGTVTINGAITANGITKSGNANLTIAVPQTNYASGWTVNSGTLQINDPQGLGQSVPGNGVTLNGALTTGGQVSQAFGQTQLILTRDMGTPELVTFSGGPITVVNEGTLRLAAGDNRNIQSPPVILDSTSTASSVGFTFDVPNNRFRGIIPNLTLNDDAVIRVTDSGSTADTGRVTAGVVNVLTGTNKDLVKIGNRTLELSGDNSTTFTGGTITVSQGTVRVRHNGSLGGAGTAVTVERNATLEIDTPAFAPNATITQAAGSIERWNREDVRGTTYNLPAGVNLQLNTNLLAARTIGLNGGSIEGFLWTDHVAPAVERTVGSAVTINLLANSFVGQNILQGQGYDAGRQPTVSQPYGDTPTGAFLRVDGNITGAFNLTKTGNDTVTLAGTGNTYNDTIVELGTLRIAKDNVLPTGKTLLTRNGGTFDLFGNDQTVGGLGVAATGTDPGGTGLGAAGRITNSGVETKTLTVNNSASFTYNGGIERNIGLTKNGTGTLTLGAENTYVGPTIVGGGTLAVTGSISGSSRIEVRSGATLDATAILNNALNIGAGKLLTGSGNVLGTVTVDGIVAPGDTAGTLTMSGLALFNNGSGLSIELLSPTSFDQLAASGISLDGTVNLDLSLGFIPAENTKFTIVNNTGTLPISGSTARFTVDGPEGVLAENEVFFADNGIGFRISYVGGTGNDVVLTTIPEPNVAASLAGGVGLLLGLRRRRRA